MPGVPACPPDEARRLVIPVAVETVRDISGTDAQTFENPDRTLETGVATALDQLSPGLITCAGCSQDARRDAVGGSRLRGQGRRRTG
jgi:hypothetical protein